MSSRLGYPQWPDPASDATIVSALRPETLTCCGVQSEILQTGRGRCIHNEDTESAELTRQSQQGNALRVSAALAAAM